jgi:hypothetical protein
MTPDEIEAVYDQMLDLVLEKIKIQGQINRLQRQVDDDMNGALAGIERMTCLR